MSLQIPMTRRIGRSTSPCTNRIQVCLHRAVVGSEAVSLGCACKRRLLAQRLFGWPGHLPGPLHTPQTMQLELHTLTAVKKVPAHMATYRSQIPHRYSCILRRHPAHGPLPSLKLCDYFIEITTAKFRNYGGQAPT